MHIVARAHRTVQVDHEFGHHEQADALDALGRAGDAGQHQMNDVLGHVVLTPGDEYLGTGDFVAAIGLGFCFGAHRGQIAAGLRLGQVHGAGPLAADEFFEVDGVEFRASSGQQGFNGAVGQQRAQGKAHIGRVLHLAYHRTNDFWQALATEVGGVLQALPARFGVLFEGFLEAWAGGHHAVFQG